MGVGDLHFDPFLPASSEDAGQVSEHFRISDFTKSATARRRNIDNTPTWQVRVCLVELCRNVLEPCVAAGFDLHINSGYRSPALNKAVRGSRTSDHMFGRAADIETRPETASNMWNLGLFIQTQLQFKQLIWEFGGEWIHVAYDGRPDKNRGQVIEAYKDGRRTRYRPFSFLGRGDSA